MRKWILIAVMALAIPVPGAGDEEGQSQNQAQRQTTRVFQLKYAPVDSIFRVIDVFRTNRSYDPNLNIISVSGPDETVEQIAEVIRSLDVPASGARNVELVFHILRARRNGPASEGQPLPESLRDVAVQMEKVLGLDDVELLETSLIRVRDGSGGSSRGILSGVGQKLAFYSISFKEASITGQGPSINLRDLRFGAKVTVAEIGDWELGINTNIDIASGQKAVVGKAGVDGQGNHLILVLMARVV